MSTDTMLSIVCTSSDDTEQFGEKLGQRLRGSEVIELISDLGGGKTTLTRGIARGAGSSDVVGSPTFTLSKVYKTPKFDIHHFDFYRLSGAGILEHELHDLIGDKKVVIIVEWADVVQQVLPEDRVTIKIIKTPEDYRRLDMAVPEKWSYLLT